MVCRNNVSRLGSLEESIAICWNSLLSGKMVKFHIQAPQQHQCVNIRFWNLYAGKYMKIPPRT